MGTLPETSAPVDVYGIDLLFQAPPKLSSDELLKTLEQECGGVEAAEPEGENNQIFTFPDLQDPERGDGKPVQLSITVVPGAVPEAEVDDALLQTRDWREARDCVKRHGARVQVCDRRAAGLPYKNRLRIFQDALVALFEVAAPIALHWKPSGKIVSPVLLQRALRNGKPDPLHGALNVRCQPSSEILGAQLVDTLGLAPLGLPDLECLAKGKDPAKISALLRAIAKYMFDLGNVIENGRIFRGTVEGERWSAERARSTEPPGREVIRLTPA